MQYLRKQCSIVATRTSGSLSAGSGLSSSPVEDGESSSDRTGTMVAPRSLAIFKYNMFSSSSNILKGWLRPTIATEIFKSGDWSSLPTSSLFGRDPRH